PPMRAYCCSTSARRSAGIRRPRVTFSMNGRTSSGAVGPPNAIRSTPSYGIASAAVRELVDHVHQRLHVLDRRLLEHAVPEIEDVPAATARATEDVLHALAN